MKKIPSVTFGEVEINEDEIYTFPEGIPGLGEITQYYIIDRPELAPFKWLQACQPNYLSLMILDPLLIDSGYNVNIRKSLSAILGDFEAGDLFLQVLIVVPKDPQQMTANLLAPLVFNRKTYRAMQTVVEGHRDLLRVKVIKD